MQVKGRGVTKGDQEYWNSDEYLKRNAAGAHSGTRIIYEKLEEFESEIEAIKSELLEVHSKLDRIDRNCWALGFGVLLLLWLTWKN